VPRAASSERTRDCKPAVVREIQGHLLELYGLDVSPDLISTIIDEVLAEVEQWQKRPLEAMYPIAYFRNSLRLASWQERKELAAALKPVYQVATEEAAAAALQELAQREWAGKFPAATAMWQRQWQQAISFFAYSSVVRKIIYARKKSSWGTRPTRLKACTCS
jgi:transposase-like protein